LQDDLLLNSLASELIHGNEVDFTDEVHLPLFNRACLKVMQRLGITKDFESAHLDAIYNLRLSQTGKRVTLKKGVVAYKSKDRIVFELEKEQEDYCFDFKLGTVFESERYILSFEKVNKKERGFLCFDGDKLPYNAIIRTKRTGDSIVTFGGQRKSLKKFLTDKKIDARISKHMPLIAVDNEVYAICPVEISKKLAVDENTKNIIIC
jgi:tRNA(Ile)-lysidine synthetase-like protein